MTQNVFIQRIKYIPNITKSAAHKHFGRIASLLLIYICECYLGLLYGSTTNKYTEPENITIQLQCLTLALRMPKITIPI